MICINRYFQSKIFFSIRESNFVAMFLINGTFMIPLLWKSVTELFPLNGEMSIFIIHHIHDFQIQV